MKTALFPIIGFLLLLSSLSLTAQVTVNPDISLGLVKPKSEFLSIDYKQGGSLRAAALFQLNSNLAVSPGFGYQYYRDKINSSLFIRTDGLELTVAPSYIFNPENKIRFKVDLTIGYSFYNTFLRFKIEEKFERDNLLTAKGFFFEPGIRVLFGESFYIRFGYDYSSLKLAPSEFLFTIVPEQSRNSQKEDPNIPSSFAEKVNYHRLLFSIGVEL
jgi:hypothetical protein